MCVWEREGGGWRKNERERERERIRCIAHISHTANERVAQRFRPDILTTLVIYFKHTCVASVVSGALRSHIYTLYMLNGHSHRFSPAHYFHFYFYSFSAGDSNETAHSCRITAFELNIAGSARDVHARVIRVLADWWPTIRHQYSSSLVWICPTTEFSPPPFTRNRSKWNRFMF